MLIRPFFRVRLQQKTTKKRLVGCSTHFEVHKNYWSTCITSASIPHNFGGRKSNKKWISFKKHNKNIPKHVHGSQKSNSIYFSKATSSLPILPTFFVPFRIPDIHPSPLGSWGVTSLAQASAKATDQCCKSWSWNQHSWLEKSHNFEETWRDYPWCFFESLPEGIIYTGTTCGFRICWGLRGRLWLLGKIMWVDWTWIS